MKTDSLRPFEFLKILGHDLRWGIVTALVQSDYKVQEPVEQLHQPQNLVSYHLKQLRDSHLLLEHRSTADGRDIYYSLDLRQVQSAYAALGIALHPALTRESRPVGTTASQEWSARILFLCTENSARSQMAEAILRYVGNRELQVFSAGTMPSHVHPNAIRVMKARGIDISAQRSKSVDEFHGQTFDYVITVCDRAREQCPKFSEGTTFIHWSLPDPALVEGGAKRDEAFEQTALILETCIHYLLDVIQAKNGVQD